MPLFLIFFLLPLLEILVFLQVGKSIGLITALLLCVLTAILGGALAASQGLKTLVAFRRALDQGRLPANEIFDAMSLAAAGALLIAPGFLTDILGFLLLISPVRRSLRRWLLRHAPSSGGAQNRGVPDAEVIEGQFERVDEDDFKDRR